MCRGSGHIDPGDRRPASPPQRCAGATTTTPTVLAVPLGEPGEDAIATNNDASLG